MSLRRLALLLTPLALWLTLLMGCGDTVVVPDGTGGDGAGGTSTGGSGGAGGDACDSTRGTLTGNVYLFALPGDPNSTVEPGMLVTLNLPTPSDPIFVMADDDGHYEVDIEARTWVVSGQDAQGGCFADQPATVDVSACGTVIQDVVLDVCVGG